MSRVQHLDRQTDGGEDLRHPVGGAADVADPPSRGSSRLETTQLAHRRHRHRQRSDVWIRHACAGRPADRPPAAARLLPARTRGPRQRSLRLHRDRRRYLWEASEPPRATSTLAVRRSRRASPRSASRREDRSPAGPPEVSPHWISAQPRSRTPPTHGRRPSAEACVERSRPPVPARRGAAFELLRRPDPRKRNTTSRSSISSTTEDLELEKSPKRRRARGRVPSVSRYVTPIVEIRVHPLLAGEIVGSRRRRTQRHLHREPLSPDP